MRGKYQTKCFTSTPAAVERSVCAWFYPQDVTLDAVFVYTNLEQFMHLSMFELLLCCYVWTLNCVERNQGSANRDREGNFELFADWELLILHCQLNFSIYLNFFLWIRLNNIILLRSIMITCKVDSPTQLFYHIQTW